MKLVINPKYENLWKFINKLPKNFDELGATIYGGRNQVKVIEYNDLQINVKSFRTPNIVNRFVYGNFRKSKARRSFEYATILLEKGINTPEPIAYLEEQRSGVFKRSFYVSIHEEFDGMMREFKWGQLEGRENLLKQFARFTAFMHDKQILHLDYSPGNILFKKSEDKYSFYLVDLNRMIFGTISMEEGCKNFCRLWGNDEMLTFIAAEYAEARGFDKQKCISLVLKYHRKFWLKFSQKHKDRTPYVNE